MVKQANLNQQKFYKKGTKEMTEYIEFMWLSMFLIGIAIGVVLRRKK